MQGQFEQDSRERFLEGSSERIEEEVDEEERQLKLVRYLYNVIRFAMWQL